MRDENTSVIVGAIVLILLLFGVFGGGMMGWGMMGPGHMWGWDGDGWGSWWGIGMMLFWLLILAAVVLGVIWFIRQGASRGNGGETQPMTRRSTLFVSDTRVARSARKNSTE